LLLLLVLLWASTVRAPAAEEEASLPAAFSTIISAIRYNTQVEADLRCTGGLSKTYREVVTNKLVINKGFRKSWVSAPGHRTGPSW
jgi:hypothetical protein